jgi:hypothetical protein
LEAANLWPPSCNSRFDVFCAIGLAARRAPGLARARVVPGRGSFVSQQAGVASLTTSQTCVQKLAHLFPNASAVRLPVRVIKMGAGRKRLEEQTVIEFGTSHEVLFASTLPLEFEDRVRVVNSDGSFDARATVVAVRYLDGRKAVAARFLGTVENWIIKP